jgi:NAD(P)-dependent dehydrogenase (short-subunit alcohol dehydrogenase family)
MRGALVLMHDPEVASQLAARLIADGFTLAPEGTLGDISTPGERGPLDVIVCELVSPAAGSFIGTPEWARAVSESVAVPFHQVRQALPQLRLGTNARVIFVIDGWRAAAHPNSTAAVAANGALIALVKTLARDLGGEGITVNAIARGPGLPCAVSYVASPLAGAFTGQVLTLGSGGEIRP